MCDTESRGLPHRVGFRSPGHAIGSVTPTAAAEKWKIQAAPESTANFVSNCIHIDIFLHTGTSGFAALLKVETVVNVVDTECWFR